MNQSNTQIVILAAGLGTRMSRPYPKTLVSILDKPIIKYLLASIAESEITSKPLVVVGYLREEMMRVLGDQVEYAIQEKPLGTGDAVKQALKKIDPHVKNIIVLYGDHAFVKSETLKRLLKRHEETSAKISLMTLTLPDFSEWRSVFSHFGRIIRNQDKKIERIVEMKEATEEEKKILEVNPAYFCFDMEWLKENINKINNYNHKKEYYLTDLVGIAMKHGQVVESVSVREPIEGIGVNTPQELEIAGKILQQKNEIRD